MDLTSVIGFLLGLSVMAYGIHGAGGLAVFLNMHGIILVLGGLSAATLLNTPFKKLLSAGKGLISVFRSNKTPSAQIVIKEIIRLGEISRNNGGLFTLQKEAGKVSHDFLKRAIEVIIATGESNAARDILEVEIKNFRIQANEQANIFRTMAVLGPMFGLLGTLLGIVQVLKNISDPAKVGPAMAVALSTAFYGILVANLVCVPIAGKIRNRAFDEAVIMEIIMQGVLGYLENKPGYIMEMELMSFTTNKKKAAKEVKK